MLFAAESGASEEQIDMFIKQCEHMAIGASYLDLILSNSIQIVSWNEEDEPQFEERTKPPEFMNMVPLAAELIISDEEMDQPTTE